MSLWQVAPDRSGEVMDDPSLAAEEHLAALDALATINAVSLTARQLAGAVVRLVGPSIPSDRPLRLLDVACGGGDITIALARHVARRLARRRPVAAGPVLEVLGVDSSERAIERARRTTAGRVGPHATLDFTPRDVVLEGCPPCDVAVSSLFLHHLDDGPAVGVLRSMAAAASLGGVVSDLVRSRTGLVLAILGTNLLARSRVARVDGPRSVRAARTPEEYRMLAARAGLPQAVVRRSWPERVLLSWKTVEAIEDYVPGVACA